MVYKPYLKNASKKTTHLNKKKQKNKKNKKKQKEGEDDYLVEFIIKDSKYISKVCLTKMCWWWWYCCLPSFQVRFSLGWWWL